MKDDVIVYAPATTQVCKGVSFTTTGKEINLTELAKKFIEKNGREYFNAISLFLAEIQEASK